MSSADLERVLERSRALGFLGPGPVAAQLRHARAFVPLVPATGRVLDLGSGGGVPGLVISRERPDVDLVLLDAARRRGEFLEWAAAELELGERVSVVVDRAESAARRVDLRHAFDLVVSRSFGPPAVAAECAAGFLRPPGSDHPGGALAVSEPPEPDPTRWSPTLLDVLQLVDEGRHGDTGAGVRLLRSRARCDERYPRRVGIPAKRPLR